MSDDHTISYKAFVREYCVRDSQHITHCLLESFQKEIITLSLKLANLRRLIITDGRFSDFNSELFEKLSKVIEQESEELLLASDYGRSHLSDFGPNFRKQITFCSFCLRLGIEVNEKNIKHFIAKLMYTAILNYYLAGRILDINGINQLKSKINEKETIDSSTDFHDEIFLTQFPDITESNRSQLEVIKEYIEANQVKEIIGKNNQKQKETKTSNNELLEFIKENASCIKCKEANGNLNCFNTRNKIRNIVESGEMNSYFNDKKLKFCLAKRLKEQNKS